MEWLENTREFQERNAGKSSAAMEIALQRIQQCRDKRLDLSKLGLTELPPLPDDLIVLGAAQAAQVEVIVIGDKDLLVLANFEGIEILSPQGFLDCYFFQE
jgi:predicted nucleic acid-binding protein